MAELQDALSDLLRATRGKASVVFLENSLREIEVGINDYEFGAKQPVKFDVYAAHISGKPNEAIGIADLVNYELLNEIVGNVIETRRFDLLENLANEILDRIFEIREIVAASVKISKVGISDISGDLGCCITRLRT